MQFYDPFAAAARETTDDTRRLPIAPRDAAAETEAGAEIGTQADSDAPQQAAAPLSAAQIVASGRTERQRAPLVEGPRAASATAVEAWDFASDQMAWARLRYGVERPGRPAARAAALRKRARRGVSLSRLLSALFSAPRPARA